MPRLIRLRARARRSTPAAVAAVAGLMAVPAFASAAVLRFDYQFNKTYKSTVSSAPLATSLGPGTNTFVKENVDSAGNRYVLDFPQGNGVQFSTMGSSLLIPNTKYTIAVLSRLNTDSPSCWRRYVDFQDGTSDTGLYQCGGALDFYNDTPGGSTPIDTGWHQIVVSRSSTGVVRGYVDGTQQWSFTDTNPDAVISADDVLRFFRDNEPPATSGEDASGAVSRIRVWDDALSPTAVQFLGRTPTTMTITPTSGAPGSTVSVSGTGYGPGDTVKVSFVDKPTATQTLLTTVIADQVGSWSTDVTVPAGATPGAADAIIGKGSKNPASVKKTYTVTGAT